MMNKIKNALLWTVCGVWAAGGCVLTSCDERDVNLSPSDYFVPYDTTLAQMNQVVYIEYTPQGAQLSGRGLDAVEVQRSESAPGRITITSHVKDMAYYVSGTSDDAQLKIYSDNKYALYLDGAQLTSKQGPVFNNQGGKSCFVVLMPGTVTTLTDGTDYPVEYDAEGAAEKNRGCFYSNGQVFLKGTGTLQVRCTGAVWYDAADADSVYIHGINIDDYFCCDADVTVDVKALHGDGLHVSDSLISITRGTFLLNAGKCGINAKSSYIRMEGGCLDVVAHTDDAIKCREDLTLTGGTLNLVSLQGFGLCSKVGNMYLKGGRVEGTSTNNFFRTKTGSVYLNGTTCMVAAADNSNNFHTSCQAYYQSRVGSISSLTPGMVLQAMMGGEVIDSLTVRQPLSRPYLFVSHPECESYMGVTFATVR